MPYFSLPPLIIFDAAPMLIADAFFAIAFADAIDAEHYFISMPPSPPLYTRRMALRAITLPAAAAMLIRCCLRAAASFLCCCC